MFRQCPEGCFAPFQKLHPACNPAPWWLQYLTNNCFSWKLLGLQCCLKNYASSGNRQSFIRWKLQGCQMFRSSQTQAGLVPPHFTHHQTLMFSHLLCNTLSLSPPQNELSLDTHQNWVYKLLRWLLVLLTPSVIPGSLS